MAKPPGQALQEADKIALFDFLRSLTMKKMMKKVLLVLTALLFAWSFAFADLTIQILQGVNKPYPIAVVPFGNDIQNTWDLPSGISGVVASDLANSGRFSNLAMSQMPAQPTNVATFNWQQWNGANTGIEYAVVGN